MAATSYWWFLQLCEEGPAEETKRGRDLGASQPPPPILPDTRTPCRPHSHPRLICPLTSAHNHSLSAPRHLFPIHSSSLTAPPVVTPRPQQLPPWHPQSLPYTYNPYTPRAAAIATTSQSLRPRPSFVMFVPFQIAYPANCDQMYENLVRIHTNVYKNKYPHLKDTSFTRVTVDECKLILATDSGKQMEEMKKGKWKKLREKFSAKNAEKDSKL
ncbi:uncharacterized protein RBU57_004627 [Macrochelys suwanniensis]